MSFWDKKIPAHLYTIFSCVFIVTYMYTHARVHIKDSHENQDTLTEVVKVTITYVAVNICVKLLCRV